MLDAVGPLQVFASANVEIQPCPPAYKLRLVSLEGGLIQSSAGIPFMTEPLPKPASLRGATVLVSGGHGTEEAMSQLALLRWLQGAARYTARFGSVCTGAFIVAQAGLLDGKQAVTHWAYVRIFQQLFPTVRMLDDAIHVRDGSTYTSAGVTAGLDLALSLIEADLGRETSLRVARQLVVPLKRAGGQRQFSAELLAQGDEPDGVLKPLNTWLKARLKQDIAVADMARVACVSERTLHRQLVELTGLSPARYLNRLRLEKACALLESSKLPLKRVAEQSGLASEYNLRRAFKLALGVSPADYRERFSSAKIKAA